MDKAFRKKNSNTTLVKVKLANPIDKIEPSKFKYNTC